MDLKKSFCILAVGLVFLMSITDVSLAAKSKAKKKKGPYVVSARSAILTNSSDGKNVYGRNIHTRVQPASTTKVMTALLVLEKLPLNKIFTVSSRAAGAPPSNIHLRPGERFKVRDLLYALLLNSANDASIVLAEAVAGSEAKFVQMMNSRAKQLGAKNTRFANSNGLPSKTAQYTTSYDMYMMFRQALKQEFFRQTLMFKYKTIFSLSGRKINLKSHNKMLFKGWRKNIFGKTGYTRAARSCFVGYFIKNNQTYIIAVFGCSRRWEDIKFIITKYGGVAL